MSAITDKPHGCQCPYCTAIHEGTAPSVDEMWERCGLERLRAPSVWLERVGAFGRSRATRAIFGEGDDR